MTGAMIFNEKAAKDMNLSTDSKIQGHISNMQTQVVGICEDFDFQSAQNTIKPYVFVVFGQYGWDLPRRAYIRTVAGADIAQVREYIHQTIVGFSPDVVPENINVRFFDDEIEFIYQKEDKALDTCYAILIPVDYYFSYRSLRSGTVRNTVSPPRDRHSPSSWSISK